MCLYSYVCVLYVCICICVCICGCRAAAVRVRLATPISKYLSTGYGLRLSTEITYTGSSKRGKTVFPENLQEAWLVLTGISENLRKPLGVFGRMWSRNPVLQFPLNPSVQTWGSRGGARAETHMCEPSSLIPSPRQEAIQNFRNQTPWVKRFRYSGLSFSDSNEWYVLRF